MKKSRRLSRRPAWQSTLLADVEPTSIGAGMPEAEWQVTRNKAKALLRAAEMAGSGFDTRLD